MSGSVRNGSAPGGHRNGSAQHGYRDATARDDIAALLPSQPAGPLRPLGAVVGGSLSGGLEVRLDAEVDVEEMAVGRYVTVEARGQLFFGMITDVELHTTIAQLADQPPGDEDDFLREVYSGTAAYAVLHVTPMLRIATLENDPPQPVKTVPSHFSRVREATQGEVERIFGADDAEHFVIGTPLDMDVKVRLDYERFVERSNGIFGKSGTGKTFLTRLVLLNVIQKSNAQRDPKKKAVHLVFDMHNEYGWQGTYEGAGGTVKGLKQLVSSSVSVFTLDEESSRKRKVKYDSAVTVGWDEIEAEDIALLQETLNLSQNAVDACHALQGRFRDRWMGEALELTVDEDGPGSELLKALSIHPATVVNLQRGLRKLTRNKPFLVPKAPANSLRAILGSLLNGKSVVLEFGRFGNEIDSYMLVANILTRRIHNEYRDLTEKAMGEDGPKPTRLMITIEEAHKFLDPRVAGQTIFGQIAREMRKYNVTLLIIDQRPSMIEAEVMSQIGTKVTCLLDNERDIDAVLAGVSGKSGLKDVLARLETKQQALILGHAVPMPIVVRPEEYTSTYERWLEDLEAKPKATVDLLYST
jgi:DNA helicase HerA-like ATPase